MFKFHKTLIPILLLLTLYYFFCHKQTQSIKEHLSTQIQENQTLKKCGAIKDKNICQNTHYCHYDNTECVTNCKRDKCENIKTEDACTFASSTSDQHNEPSCYWNQDNCRKCPWDYVMPDPVTKELTCFKDRCDKLNKTMCESKLFSSTCCWNEKKNECECRSKKSDPNTKQCIN